MQTFFINPAWDAAGVSIRQAKAINKYTNWKARHFRAVNTFNYDTDITPDNYNVDEFIQLVRESDVIHFCSAEHSYQSQHNWGFNWADELKGKITIFHDYCSFLGHWRDRAKTGDCWNRCSEIGYSAIFSSIPQAVHIYKGCVYIPDIVDESSDEFKIENRNFDKVIIGHFPTGGGNNKNQFELNKAIEIAKKTSNIQTVITTGHKHSDIIELKKQINLGFDALWREYHGMTTVENLALGIPTMCNICDEFYIPFYEFFQCKFDPFEHTENVNDIVKCIEYYSKNLDKLKERSIEVSNFMKNYWSASNIAKRIVKEYERLLNK